MTSRELFDAGLRIIGVLVALWGLYNLLDILAVLPDLVTDPDDLAANVHYVIDSILYGVPATALGLLMVACGHWFTNLAYPERPKPPRIPPFTA